MWATNATKPYHDRSLAIELRPLISVYNYVISSIIYLKNMISETLKRQEINIVKLHKIYQSNEIVQKFNSQHKMSTGIFVWVEKELLVQFKENAKALLD